MHGASRSAQRDSPQPPAVRHRLHLNFKNVNRNRLERALPPRFAARQKRAAKRGLPFAAALLWVQSGGERKAALRRPRRRGLPSALCCRGRGRKAGFPAASPFKSGKPLLPPRRQRGRQNRKEGSDVRMNCTSGPLLDGLGQTGVGGIRAAGGGAGAGINGRLRLRGAWEKWGRPKIPPQGRDRPAPLCARPAPPRRGPPAKYPPIQRA